jgi:hypothetical protein
MMEMPSMMPIRNQRMTVVSSGLLAIMFLAATSLNAQSDCTSVRLAPETKVETKAAVPGDRWMEIDLYWFEQDNIAESVRCFWDRFQPLYERVSGDRGVILNVGWTVGYIMEWSGEPDQRISLPAGTGQQPWVEESTPLAGSTEERRRAWKARFATPTIVTRKGYGPWTYRDLRRLTDGLRAEAAKRGIDGFKVGSLAYAWVDAYGEVAPWAKVHPEAFTLWQFERRGEVQSGRFFDPGALLHRDSSKLGGLPQGLAEAMPVYEAFAAQWGSLSKTAGLDAIMLRDSFGMPVPYQRAGPNGIVEPSPEAIRKQTQTVSALVRETKAANSQALVMMYSNAASAIGDWRSNGLDVEQIAREGSLDVWVDQTWAGAWNEVGVRHNSFWNQPTLGWTYQLTSMLMHSAMLAGTKARHYPLIETFDAWESWDVLHTVPERLRWGIWAYSHASVKTPGGIKVPDGSYISWANQGKRLLSGDDVAFLNSNISQAVIDAHKVTEVYGPTLVYARSSSKWQAEHARPDHDVKEWLDEQAGSIIKWPVPVLSATRIEWLPQVASDMFVLGAPSHLSPEETSFLTAAARRGTPIASFGSPAGGIDSSLQRLAGLRSADAQSASPTVQPGEASNLAAQLAPDAPLKFPVRQSLSRNTVTGSARTVYSVAGSPALVLSQPGVLRLLAWDPPEFLDEWDKELLDIWGGSAAPYALAAGGVNALLTRSGSLHVSEIDLQQTVNLSAWRTSDGMVHLLTANLEEGLRDDADMSRHTTIELPSNWRNLRWSSLWPGAEFKESGGPIRIKLDQARSIQLEAVPETTAP